MTENISYCSKQQYETYKSDESYGGLSARIILSINDINKFFNYLHFMFTRYVYYNRYTK